MNSRLASSFSRRLVVDQRERAGNAFQRVRMEFQPVDVGDVEEADEVDRIALEDIGVGQRNAAAVLDEFDAAGDLAVAVGEAADDAR